MVICIILTFDFWKVFVPQNGQNCSEASYSFLHFLQTVTLGLQAAKGEPHLPQKRFSSLFSKPHLEHIFIHTPRICINSIVLIREK